jgi:hypothetical protein
MEAFQIVALIFTLSNGAPSPEPVSTITGRRKFETMEVCNDFLTSEKGQAMTAYISDQPEFHDGTAIVRFQCQPAVPE